MSLRPIQRALIIPHLGQKLTDPPKYDGVTVSGYSWGLTERLRAKLLELGAGKRAVRWLGTTQGTGPYHLDDGHAYVLEGSGDVVTLRVRS